MGPSSGSEAAPRFSVVLAARNEAESLGAVIDEIGRHLPQPHEIIVVDDGSADGTGDVALQKGAILIRHEECLGKGAALLRGMDAAVGEYLVFLDADGQDPPSELPALLAELESGADFVNGSKFIGRLGEGAISRPNYWGNRFMTALVNLLYGARITDSQSGFRIIDRRKAASVRYRSREYEIETEMLIVALKRKWTVREAPVLREGRAHGTTNFKRVRNGLRILTTILRMRLTG